MTDAPTEIPMSAGQTALVLGGGGARGAYQAGVLRAIGRRHPGLRIPVLTGISAGAINTAFLAAHDGSFASAAEALATVWLGLTSEQVYDVHALSLARNVARWGWKLASGGVIESSGARAMVNTDPLERMLRQQLNGGRPGCIAGIQRNIDNGRFAAVALSATSYSTGESVTWVQGGDIALWERPLRRSEAAELGVEHVMASAALPLFFPARRVGGEWFGDGGIRLTAPLSPALHLGAERILTISTRHVHSASAADQSHVYAYPPPAQVLGILYNAVFLDVIDQDVLRLEMINRLLRKMPPSERGQMRPVEVLILRPSRDLGQMARAYEPRLPPAFRFLTRGWGTRHAASPDILSLMMFQSDYVRALIELGEQDADAQADRIDRWVGADLGARAAS